LFLVFFVFVFFFRLFFACFEEELCLYGSAAVDPYLDVPVE